MNGETTMLDQYQIQGGFGGHQETPHSRQFIQKQSLETLFPIRETNWVILETSPVGVLGRQPRSNNWK